MAKRPWRGSSSGSGYADCSCRDCFDTAIADGTTHFCTSCGEAGCVLDPPAICWECEEAGCSAQRDEDCRRDDAYGGAETVLK